jgi:hypothetical protein
MCSIERTRKHSGHTSCYTYFRITGDFDPDTISEMLGLTPEKIWKIGDTRKDGKSQYDFSSWHFGSCREYDAIVENQMLKTITPLFEKIEILKQIKQKFHVFYTLEVVPTVWFDEAPPCLAPSMKVMQFCCDTGTEIDIDLYIDYPDDFVKSAAPDDK